jgi:hypothetical protein
VKSRANDYTGWKEIEQFFAEFDEACIGDGYSAG